MTNHAETNGPPRFRLHVRRGRTEHPARPIDRETFLIGSDECCHLRLGDPAVPGLHSALRIVGEFVEAVPLAPAPPLQVNGVEADEALLEHGDVLSVAGFEFSLEDTRVGSSESPVAEVSAAELVDLLEADLELVERDLEARRAGATELFEAVRERRERDVQTAAVQRIDEVTTQIESRVDQLLARERRLGAAVEELLETQRHLEERLKQVETQLLDKIGGSRRAA